MDVPNNCALSLSDESYILTYGLVSVLTRLSALVDFARLLRGIMLKPCWVAVGGPLFMYVYGAGPLFSMNISEHVTIDFDMTLELSSSARFATRYVIQ